MKNKQSYIPKKNNVLGWMILFHKHFIKSKYKTLSKLNPEHQFCGNVGYNAGFGTHAGVHVLEFKQLIWVNLIKFTFIV